MKLANGKNIGLGKTTPEIEPIPSPAPNTPAPEITPNPGKDKPETPPKPDIEPYIEPKTEPGKNNLKKQTK